VIVPGDDLKQIDSGRDGSAVCGQWQYEVMLPRVQGSAARRAEDQPSEDIEKKYLHGGFPGEQEPELEGIPAGVSQEDGSEGVLRVARIAMAQPGEIPE